MSWIHQEPGQSLVELALIVPFLLIILLGVADLGRAFYYTTAIASAAREGAAYAASSAYAIATAAQRQTGLNTKACAATGLDVSYPWSAATLFIPFVGQVFGAGNASMCASSTVDTLR